MCLNCHILTLYDMIRLEETMALPSQVHIKPICGTSYTRWATRKKKLSLYDAQKCTFLRVRPEVTQHHPASTHCLSGFHVLTNRLSSLQHHAATRLRIYTLLSLSPLRYNGAGKPTVIKSLEVIGDRFLEGKERFVCWAIVRLVGCGLHVVLSNHQRQFLGRDSVLVQ